MAESNLIRVVGNQLFFAGKVYKCAFGKNGFSANKKEGDGCTPLGVFLLRECWYRADKIGIPKTSLPLKIISENDGWCDDVASLEYNQHIIIAGGSPRHEKLWRDDGVYDLIIPLGYNDEPIITGKGSAIFMHIAKPDYSGTEGCIALALPDLLEIISQVSTDCNIEISPN